MPINPESLNPVSFSGIVLDGLELEGDGFTVRGYVDRSKKEEINVTVGRLHISGPQTNGTIQEGAARLGGENLEKCVAIVVWKDEETILANAVIDEEHLVRGLQLLFPHRELER